MKKRSKILKLSVLLFSFFIGIYSINAVTVTTSEYFPNNTVVKKIMSGQNAYCLDGALDAPKAGAEYSFTSLLGVYLEPSLGYYFDDGSTLEHYYKEHPMAPSISFGLRFNLNPRSSSGDRK